MTRLLVAVLFAGTVAARAQSVETLERLSQRMDLLERQNAELQEQIRSLRAELDTVKGSAQEAAAPVARVEALEEQVQLQAGRLAEQDQIKMQSSQRTPVRLTGIVLFNAFLNSRHGGQAFDYPPTALRLPDRSRSGATLSQSVFGLEFQAPDAVLGGRFRGSLLLDLSSGERAPTTTQVRLRTASIEGQWKTRSFLVGQEKPIFSPREPNSLARLETSPLTSAGNLWMWRPQARFEQRIKLGPGQELRAQIGVSQTRDDLGTGGVPAQFLASLEPKRPALEANFRFTHRIDDFRRIEIAHGFHWSTTHVAATSVPANVFSVDWFFNPLRKVEFTGTAFTGKNLAKLGGTNSVPSYVISTPRPGQIQVIPIGGRGGWAQLTWLATSRLSFNVFSGQHHTDHRELLASTIRYKNVAYGANFFYKLAPNVIAGIEAAQTRSWYIAGEHPRYNHYDLYVGYLF
jgi:hypothetical protein